MILRNTLMAAAFLLAATAAHADENLSAAILNCSALPTDAAQLACYRHVAAQIKADAAGAPPVRDTGNAPVAAQNTFGSSAAPEPLDHIIDRIADVTYSGFGHFTVTLKNGQVWQQTEGSTVHLHKDQTVIVKHGSLGGFHLSIQSDVGIYGSYEVKRIK
ncbi:MAG TPA: hypothetical protein VHZ78_11295 [Rhizomicrobium sp.]|jgi:hypothetical protein|nr:hypothetical protein [Rhizomicrobium sp.]